MAYEMHEWVCNEPITADKLNHMEQGIVEAQNDESSGGDVLIIRQDDEATTSSKKVYDKTWQEVFDALKVGTRVIFLQETELPPSVANADVSMARNDTTQGGIPYGVYSRADAVNPLAQADTADGYLYAEIGGNA